MCRAGGGEQHARLGPPFAKDQERATRRLVHIPMGHFAEALEITAAAAFLTSAAYVTPL